MLDTEEGISIILPVKNESHAISDVIKNIHLFFFKKYNFEIIIIDDNSDQENFNKYKNITFYKNIFFYRIEKNIGQSRAVDIGINNSNYNFVLVMDSDGQINVNDFKKIETYLDFNVFKLNGLIIGDRSKNRRDNFFKRTSSKFARLCRKIILNDVTNDSGCGFKFFKKKDYLKLPYFDNIHRYFPVLFKREGLQVNQVEISHFDRIGGKSKYGNLDRLIAGIFDIIGVIWLLKRKKVIKYKKMNFNE